MPSGVDLETGRASYVLHFWFGQWICSMNMAVLPAVACFTFPNCTRLKVRAVQRRLGMLACTSDLSEEFKEHLRGIQSALEQQRSCNTAVDVVVSQEVILTSFSRPHRYRWLFPVFCLPFSRY